MILNTLNLAQAAVVVGSFLTGYAALATLVGLWLDHEVEPALLAAFIATIGASATITTAWVFAADKPEFAAALSVLLIAPAAILGGVAGAARGYFRERHFDALG